MSDSQPPPVPDVERDFDAWARLSARLRAERGEARQRHLAELSLSQRWAEIDARWRYQLVEDVAVGNMERVFRYSELCAKYAAAAAEADEPSAPPEPPPLVAPPASVSVPADSLNGDPPSAPTPSSVGASEASVSETWAHEPSSDSASWPTGDFRHEFGRPSEVGVPPVEEDEEGPTLVAWSRSTVTGKIRSYVERLDGEGSPPEPSPYQSHTQLPLIPAMRSDLEAAQIIAKWPVESYAAFCAKLANYPERSEQLCAEVGLRSDQALVHVRRAWAKRFRVEPGLQARWQQLVVRFQQPVR